MRCSNIALVLTAMSSTCESFTISRMILRHNPIPCRTPSTGLPFLTVLHTQQGGNNSEEGKSSEIEDALRRLENLESLDDFPERSPPKANRGDGTIGSENIIPNTPPVSLEKEVQIYQDMVKELETTDEQELYDAILSEMGGTSASSPSSDTSDAFSGGDNEAFMRKAFEEALIDVEKDKASISSDVLNDKELMREIKAIFERGNEKLMSSLEDIRREQSDLARASAARNAQKGLDTLSNESRRLEQAEASMASMLDRVNKEASEVAKAVEDLQKAQSELDRDFLYRLKKGGIAKQGAMVGVVLFSIRSIIDSIASFGDESHITAALAQGAIAILCAAFFFLA